MSEGVESGRVTLQDRRGKGAVHVPRKGDELIRMGHDPTGQCPDDGLADHQITDTVLLDCPPHAHDPTGELSTWNERRLELQLVRAADDQDVEIGQTGELDLDLDLIRTGGRIGHFLDTQVFNRTGLVTDNGAHESEYATAFWRIFRAIDARHDPDTARERDVDDPRSR